MEIEKMTCTSLVSRDTLRPAQDENPIRPTRAGTWVAVLLLLASLAGIVDGVNRLFFQH